MPYIVAGGVAALLAAIEQFNRLPSRFTLRGEAGVWWAARLVVEFGVGIAAVWLFRRLTDDPFADELVGWVLAGAAGPAIVRFRFIDFGRAGVARPVGLATLYEPLRGLIEKQLDDASADKQSEWVNTKLLPSLERKGVHPADLGQNLKDYYTDLDRLATTDKVAERQFIDETLAGEGSDPVKREAIVRRAIALDGYRVLNRLQKRGPSPGFRKRRGKAN